MTPLVVVVFVAEDALEGIEWLTVSLKSSFRIFVEKILGRGSTKCVSHICGEKMSEFRSSRMLVLSSDPLCDEEEEEDCEGFDT